MKKTIYLFAFASTLFIGKAYSQPAFSLINTNKMVFNPAYTAIDTAYRHSASLYSQINSTAYQSPYSSSIGTYQMRLDKIKSGVGIMVNYNYDVFPSETDKQIAAKLYYRYTILPGFSVGADAGLVNSNSNFQFTYNWNRGFVYPAIVYQTFPQQATVNNLAFDGGLGILYQHKSFYVGFGTDHLTSPKSTYIAYNYESGSIDNFPIPMHNYSGISYNWIIGSSVHGEAGGVNFSAAYRSNILSLNTSLESSHIFVGFSMFYDVSGNSLQDMFINNGNYYALTAGLKLWHNKINASFAYDYSGSFFSSATLEGGLSYSF